MDLQLAGRRALVTGGSEGIDLACAEALAEEGCDLLLAARDAAALNAAANRVRGLRQVAVQTIPADLSRQDQVERLAQEAGDLDILVNNGGATPPARS